MDIRNFVDTFVGIFDMYDEGEKSLTVILDKEVAHELALELEFLGKNFISEYEIGITWEEDMDKNDIMSVCSYDFQGDGERTYFFSSVIHSTGETLYSECDDYIIQDDLVDCLQLERLTGSKLTVSVKEILDIDILE